MARKAFTTALVRARKAALPTLTVAKLTIGGRSFRRHGHIATATRARMRHQVDEWVAEHGPAALRSLLQIVESTAAYEADEYDGAVDEVERLADDSELPAAERERYADAAEDLREQHDLLDTMTDELDDLLDRL